MPSQRTRTSAAMIRRIAFQAVALSAAAGAVALGPAPATAWAAQPEPAVGESLEGRPEPGDEPTIAQLDTEVDVLAVPTTRIERATGPITIDGLLDDPAWRDAPSFDAFIQADPIAGATPSQPTRVWLAYDDENLYLGIRLFDEQPDEIVVRQMQRDASQQPDDRVSIVIDPFGKQREGYFFQVNAAGAKRDGLIDQGDRLRTEWDGIWDAKATIDGRGWIAEVAIPFKTIAFAPDAEAWGLNIERVIRRADEGARWATPVRGRGITDVGIAGRLVGLEGLERGAGVDIKPFFTFTAGGGEAFEGQPDYDVGGDVVFQITPDLTATFTVNTDFAATEVDARQINLTRFPLFFPEKRDFFLQDAGLFRFGGINQSPLPFFSRRIGLVRGEEVDIRWGAKLTGRIDDFSVGLLSVRQAGFDDLDARQLSVGRLAYNVLEESSVGVIFTDGDPTSDRDNSLVGVDFNYRNTRDFPGAVLEAAAWGQLSQTEGAEEDESAIGGRFSFDSDTFAANAFVAHVGEDYNPGLGFIARPGRREYNASARVRFRTDDQRDRVDLRTSGTAFTTLGGEIETLSVTPLELTLGNQRGDFGRLFYRVEEENLLGESFEIAPNVVIDDGVYTFSRYGIELGTGETRALSASGRATFGGFYDGQRADRGVSLTWRPSRFFTAAVDYDQSDISLPAGSFRTEIARVRLNASFTPDISWNNFIQYDNFSDTVGLNSRLNWIVEPGREVFLVLNQGFDVADGGFASRGTEMTVKVELTFRF
jgi:hypothetical protein